jgi:hypothetical protein
MEVTMTHIILWLVIVAGYFLLIVLICKCMILGDRKYKKVTPPMNRARRADRVVPGVTELPARNAAKSACTKAA